MVFFLSSLIVAIIVILLFTPATFTKYLHRIALVGAFSLFVASLVLLTIPFSKPIFIIAHSYTLFFFPGFVVTYSYMIDNIAVAYIILSTFLNFVVVLLTRTIQYRVKEKYLLLYTIQLLLIACFVTTELLFFYLVFEALLIPVFTIIGIWGSQKDKVFAANQFLLYTLFGSLFMLVAIILLFILVGTTNILILKDYEFQPIIEVILFSFIFLGLAVKIPIFPFHLWLPKAHVEAPTTGSVLLAGILLKLGSYGFLRFLVFLFPTTSFYCLPIISSIAMISIVLSSFTVLRQVDLKRIIAYSSVAHMNFLIGVIFANNILGVVGSLLLQVAHGISSSALFILIGIIYDRYKSRNLYYFRSLSTIMPMLSFCFFLFSLSNLGFPSTMNFVAEMTVFLGLFNAIPSIAIISLVGVLLSAAYSLILVTRVIFGSATKYIQRFYDLTRREFYILLPLSFLIVFFGLFPTYITSLWSLNVETWSFL